MDPRLSAKFRWILQNSLSALGWPGVVGLGLLAFCAVVYMSAILPAQHRLAEMKAQTQSLRALLAKNTAAQKEVVTPEVQLNRFYQFFPAHTATPDLLEKLYAAAEAASIVLEQGDYRLAAGKGDKVAHYQVTLPVKGSYPQIRKFIGRILADLPASSLDEVSFQRQKIGDMQVESQIKLTLYLGDEGNKEKAEKTEPQTQSAVQAKPASPAVEEERGHIENSGVEHKVRVTPRGMPLKLSLNLKGSK